MSNLQDNNTSEDEYRKEIKEQSKQVVNEIFFDLKKYNDIKLSNGNKHVFCIDYKFDEYQDLNDISFDNNFNDFCNDLFEMFQTNNYIIKDFQIDYVEGKGFFKKYRIAKLKLIYV